MHRVGRKFYGAFCHLKCIFYLRGNKYLFHVKVIVVYDLKVAYILWTVKGFESYNDYKKVFL